MNSNKDPCCNELSWLMVNGQKTVRALKGINTIDIHTIIRLLDNPSKMNIKK